MSESSVGVEVRESERSQRVRDFLAGEITLAYEAGELMVLSTAIAESLCVAICLKNEGNVTACGMSLMNTSSFMSSMLAKNVVAVIDGASLKSRIVQLTEPCDCDQCKAKRSKTGGR